MRRKQRFVRHIRKKTYLQRVIGRIITSYQQDRQAFVMDHATTSSHTKAAKDQFRSPEVELTSQGHVNPEVAKHSTSYISHHSQSNEDRSNLDKSSESNERIRRDTTTVHEAVKLFKSHKDLE
ncbi:unnamed protein product [Caenorhabditis brenneri]